MEIVAKLSANTDLTKLANQLKGLGYEVCELNKKVIFVYNQRRNPTELKRDIQTAKQASNIRNTITVIYGSLKTTA